MNQPLVSVIIPCFNEIKTIQVSLESIIKQDFPVDNYEILVIDGLSTDGTREILKELYVKYKNFILIDNESGKTPVARNVGVKASKGKYIAILDAHTIYESDYLKNCVNLLESKEEIACTGCPYISKGISSFGKATALAISHPFGIGNAKHRYPDYEGFAEGAAFPVFRRKVFDEIGLFDENLIRNQDDEFNFRMKQKGLKVYITPKNKCVYFVRESPAKLFKQYFEYGFWRVAVIYKHRMPVSFRQLIPFLFLLSIITFIILGVIINTQRMIFIFAIPVLYISVLFALTIKMIRETGIKIGLLFPFSIIILHFSYGLGFIIGLLSKKTRLKNKFE